MLALLSSLLTWLALGFLAYAIIVNSLYLGFAAFAYFALVRHRRRWTPRELGGVMRSPATPGVSIVVPAFNEEKGIVDTVRSLLMLNYPQFEIIVVSDGSTDGTLVRLQQAFGLLRAPGSYESRLSTARIRGVYRSLAIPELVVIDKLNGGKADAINAAINAAQFPLFCIIDADCVLEEHALTRAVLPFIEDPSTVATGGIVRIGNGCVVDHGRVTDVRAPSSWLARFQVVEYLRAFLAARVTYSAFNALLIVSGAFGLFRRDVVVEAGGLDTHSVTEDMELIVRLHRFCRDRGRPYRIVFQPDPVVWTEAPEALGTLARQRNRWQRGTLQVLLAQWSMMGNPRYGRIGLVALPFYALFETFGPILETVGLVFTILASMVGLLDWRMAELLFLAAVFYGTTISVASLLLEEVSFRRYLRLGDVGVLLAAAVLENFGYRQMTTWWRLQGIIDYWRGRTNWGVMARKGLSTHEADGTAG
jgi:cellulose synthase/poly-beta-1,6-N-acetylglucosamine synthase-like glycosyltransferase